MRVAEAEFSLTAQALDSRANGAPNPDDRLNVSFSLQPEQDMEASDREGRPIFVEKEYVTIIIPGDRDIMHRRAWRKDFERFPRQYAAFKNRQSQPDASGTPLRMVTWLTPSQIKELEYFNCTTVEQLAEVPDTHAHRFQQINKLKQLARDYLQAAKEIAPLTSMRAEMEKKDSRIEVLERQVRQLMEVVEAGKEEESTKKKVK